jgi:predicted ATPase
MWRASDSQQAFRTTALDPDLLSTPFRIRTNWHVIAGAPCSGKTTLIGQLAGKGFQTVPEAGRLFIEQEMAGGRTIHPIFEDGAALQRGIAEMQLEIEGGFRAEDVAFLDGAVPSSLAWYRAYGLDPNEILPECFRHRYALVFLLDRLPFQPDEERVEEVAALGAYLDEWLARDYRALGYRVVRVPALPPGERLAFLLERLSEQGLT